jgi:amino acid transporter
VPFDNPNLLSAGNNETKFSPYIIAMTLAGIKVLPSIFNVIITVSVISVANSCTYASTRTMQALAERGMAPKLLSYVDSKGRPIYGIILQMLFALLAFIGESSQQSLVFTWLLSLTGLSYFFIWGAICLAHIRFRYAWKAQGHSLSELPYESTFGIGGSYFGLFMNILCLIATFYAAISVNSHYFSF